MKDIRKFLNESVNQMITESNGDFKLKVPTEYIFSWGFDSAEISRLEGRSQDESFNDESDFEEWLSEVESFEDSELDLVFEITCTIKNQYETKNQNFKAELTIKTGRRETYEITLDDEVDKTISSILTGQATEVVENLLGLSFDFEFDS